MISTSKSWRKKYALTWKSMESTSWRKNVCHKSNIEKYVILSKICHNVNRYNNIKKCAITLWCQERLNVQMYDDIKVRHDINIYGNTSWCQKANHNIKKYVIISKSMSKRTSWGYEVHSDINKSTVRHNFKKYGKYVMVSNICHNVQ